MTKHHTTSSEYLQVYHQQVATALTKHPLLSLNSVYLAFWKKHQRKLSWSLSEELLVRDYLLTQQ